MTADAVLIRAVRHNTWANLELLAFCAALTAEQLAWTTPGTYGTLHSTLHHIVGAEHGYLHGLTGLRPPIETERGGRAMTPDWQAPITELIERARSNGERLVAVLDGELDPARMIKRPSGAIAAAAIIVAQYLHHGSDHRAHVGTILGAHGVAGPNLDVWAYGRSTGEVIPPPAS
ncbi:MAG TPA: DinB family protein [Candidatus Limnocylindria bacterium]|nr:DinB family protein [Candidatus Limnocylindria bacterium]